MTTTTASASCTENIRLVREMLKTVKPNDLTDDEIVAMVEILRAAADRKQETQPGVVYLDLVRSGLPFRAALSLSARGRDVARQALREHSQAHRRRELGTSRRPASTHPATEATVVNLDRLGEALRDRIIALRSGILLAA